VICYDRPRGRWKISEDQGSRPGFAWASCEQGAPLASRGLRWEVFEGREFGYRHDPDVRVFSPVNVYVQVAEGPAPGGLVTRVVRGFPMHAHGWGGLR
jgi:hypothetical protein